MIVVQEMVVVVVLVCAGGGIVGAVGVRVGKGAGEIVVRRDQFLMGVAK